MKGESGYGASAGNGPNKKKNKSFSNGYELIPTSRFRR